MGPLLAHPPVAGGLDLDLPGRDVRLRATRWPGAGPPVLLLHGLASSRRFWDLVVPGLAGLPVIALDQRGHGDSERPAGPYDGATVSADALLALDALGLSRVVVAGHSWGASVALRLAAAAPERVLAVVALDGGLGTTRSAGGTREQARERLTPPPFAVPEAELRDDDDEQGRLAAVRCPAWLVSCEPVGGGDDWSVAKAAALDRAAGSLATPRLLRWAGAVHDVPLQWPALVAGLIRAAVDEVRTAAPGAGTLA